MAAMFRNSFRQFVSQSSPYCDPLRKPRGRTNPWKLLSTFVALPLVVVLSIYNELRIRDVKEYERPPFIPYEHLRIRTKRFPWGDGTKTLFHNPLKNALPDGYEDFGEDTDGSDEEEEVEE